VTPRERTVIRVVIRALQGEDTATMDALGVSYYGLNYHASKPTKDRVVALLTALIQRNLGNEQ